MDMIKIGKFLRELRKEKGLTQAQLGEQIGTTDKTISRWETGTYLPPVEMLMILSRLYDISINEIISGERLSEEEFIQKAEENITAVLSESTFSVREKKEFFISKWNREHLFTNILSALVFISAIIAGILTGNPAIPLLSALGGFAWAVFRNNQKMAYIERNIYPKNKEE